MSVPPQPCTHLVEIYRQLGIMQKDAAKVSRFSREARQFDPYVHRVRSDPRWNTSPGSGAEHTFCTLIPNRLIPVPQMREPRPRGVCARAGLPAQVHLTRSSLLPGGPDGNAEMHRELAPARGC